MAAPDSHIDQDFVDAVREKTWQQLRPLEWYLPEGSGLVLLSGRAYQYYLPAYLFALIDAPPDSPYLGPVLDSLWPEGLYFDLPVQRSRWEERMPLLTPEQKHCIASILKHVLRRTDDRFLEDGSEARRLEKMLKQYWSAYDTCADREEER